MIVAYILNEIWWWFLMLITHFERKGFGLTIVTLYNPQSFASTLLDSYPACKMAQLPSGAVLKLLHSKEKPQLFPKIFLRTCLFFLKKSFEFFQNLVTIIVASLVFKNKKKELL